jgi:outer membrane protein assembly factor BamB
MKLIHSLMLIPIYLLTTFSTCTSSGEQAYSSQKAIINQASSVATSIKIEHAVAFNQPHFFYEYNLPAEQIDTKTPVSFDQDYQSQQGLFCFRGNAQRSAPSRGRLKTRPQKLRHIWSFKTATNTSPTEFGIWGGGTGWTGQPLYVHWKNQTGWKDNLNPEFGLNQELHEVIVGTLSGHVYFIDLLSGKASRKPINIENPIKGTVSLHPELNGMLFVGQGIQQKTKFGNYTFNMLNGKLLQYHSGADAFAFRGWGAFDSNPLIESKSGYLFWPAENGLIYRYKINPNNQLSPPLKLRYKVKDKFYQGLEASFAAYQNMGYFADNSGNVFALNLETMQPVWYFDNLDDSDASIAIDIEAGIPYLYLGNEVDKQGQNGAAYFRKINGNTGKEVWSQVKNCNSNSEINGGILSSALIGKFKAQNTVMTVFSRVGKSLGGEIKALNKQTGELLYSIPLKSYSWSSPVDIYDEEGNMYFVLGDASGKLTLYDGQTGDMIDSVNLGSVIESSPIAIDNRIVIGSRGSAIHSYEIE